jgi:glutathione S-transferase
MLILEEQLRRTGRHVAGEDFTLADIVLGLSTNRWLSTPIEHPDCPAILAWFDRLAGRPGFRKHCRNGVP